MSGDIIRIQTALKTALSNKVIREHLGIDRAEAIDTIDDFRKLPFMTKDFLRRSNPFELMCAGEEEIVRIHSTSGTTGEPVIIPYTRRDVDVFREMVARSLRMAGIGALDRVMVTPGYGLWTAGIGFQSGVEELGACAIPIGPIPMESQMAFIRRMNPSAVIGTASFALLLGETVHASGANHSLKKAILGAEQWGEQRRKSIENLLGVESFDIYGMTETYGPGLAIECNRHEGLHIWDDMFFIEIIDPDTGEILPDGEQGELVVTSLVKEGLPLVRYRTRDILSIIPGKCMCGSTYPRISRVCGRTDDMIIFRGVNIYPSAVEKVIAEIPGLSSEFKMMITTNEGRDNMTIEVEQEGQRDPLKLGEMLKKRMKTILSIAPLISVMPYGSLERSVKKTRRIFDLRTN